MFVMNHSFYNYVRTLSEEEKADRDMAKYGGAEAAASALIQTYRCAQREFEDELYDFKNYYEDETPDPDLFCHYCEIYAKRIKGSAPVWDEMLKHEILARSADHPTVKMRIDSFGVPVKADETPRSEKLSEEVRRAIAFLDKLNHELVMQDFEKDREQMDLVPLRKVEEWRAAGEPVTPDGYRPIVEALSQLGKMSEAEALCRRATEELPDTAALYAYYTLGCRMLRRYDDKGIECIYHALENNNNYVTDGLDMIGRYCCMTGNQAELDKYREKAIEYAVKERDEASEISELKRGDKLTAETLPDGGLEELVGVIRKASDGKIDAAYLVRKTVSDSVFSSAVILKCSSDCTEEERFEIYRKVFFYLDTVSYEGVDDWQFSLFMYEDVKNAGFESVEGSLIYKKE